MNALSEDTAPDQPASHADIDATPHPVHTVVPRGPAKSKMSVSVQQKQISRRKKTSKVDVSELLVLGIIIWNLT